MSSAYGHIVTQAFFSHYLTILLLLDKDDMTW